MKNVPNITERCLQQSDTRAFEIYGSRASIFYLHDEHQKKAQFVYFTRHINGDNNVINENQLIIAIKVIVSCKGFFLAPKIMWNQQLYAVFFDYNIEITRWRLYSKQITYEISYIRSGDFNLVPSISFAKIELGYC